MPTFPCVPDPNYDPSKFQPIPREDPYENPPLRQVNPFKPIVQAILSCSTLSIVLKVLRGRTTLVLKLYRPMGPETRDARTHEVNAYRHLQSRHLDLPVTRCLGTICLSTDNIKFAKDLHDPGIKEIQSQHAWPGIVLEYIKDAKTMQDELDLEPGEGELQALKHAGLEALEKLNAAGVLHGDTYPRNCLVQRGGGRMRIVWIDFDATKTSNHFHIAQTVYDEDNGMFSYQFDVRLEEFRKRREREEAEEHAYEHLRRLGQELEQEQEQGSVGSAHL